MLFPYDIPRITVTIVYLIPQNVFEVSFIYFFSLLFCVSDAYAYKSNFNFGNSSYLLSYPLHPCYTHSSIMIYSSIHYLNSVVSSTSYYRHPILLSIFFFQLILFNISYIISLRNCLMQTLFLKYTMLNNLTIYVKLISLYETTR